MKQTRNLMGMHITVQIVDAKATEKDIDRIYEYFSYIDETFSTYKETSEISKINQGKIHKNHYSRDMKKILLLCEQTKIETNGYFDIDRSGKLDPSGIVKGWAIWQAAELLKKSGFHNYFVDAGGDIQVSGTNEENKMWTIGIRNPFYRSEIIKVIHLDNKGIATSGVSERGQHIYNPHSLAAGIKDIVSLSVIASNVYEADRFATAAFAMGKKGINFIEKLPGIEGYMIDRDGIATYTSGFDKYVIGTGMHINL